MRDPEHRSNVLEVFIVFLRLGLTSFGGPIAHLGYFRDEFVVRRRWLDEHAYIDLVALGQFLPGPASSQVGIAVGLSRGGLLGGVAAWLGFTLPSAVILVAFAWGLDAWSGSLGQGVLHGLKLVAVAVVAQAVWSMWRRLCPDWPRTAIAAVAASAMLAASGPFTQILLIVGAALTGRFLPAQRGARPSGGVHPGVSRSTAIVALGAFLLFLALLPVSVRIIDLRELQIFDSFYRAGALVFGGGHVVLPLLQVEVVPRGWVSNDAFLAGYGAAQAVPGPLFTFAAYLGAVMGGVGGAVLSLLAIFLPAFLLVVGALPFWVELRGNRRARSAIAGVNAAVVGLLFAALYDPVFIGSVRSLADLLIALAALILLTVFRFGPLLVVAGTILAAVLLA